MTVLQHLHSRYLNTELHTTWVNEDEGVATFPLWNLSGGMVGYQQYRPTGDKKLPNNRERGKYFACRRGRVGVWGLESWGLSDTLFVTEGVFDASRLTWLGYSAVATLSNDVDDSLKRWLWTVRKSRRVVTVCDNDNAGRRLAKYGHISYVVESGDLGDATDEYVANLVKEYA